MIIKKQHVPKDVLGIKQEFHETPRMINLSKAVLCIDCETIFMRKENKIGTSNNPCPNCGSNTTRFVAKFLNRKE
jgi:rRNA maturation endonuclease Nob1